MIPLIDFRNQFIKLLLETFFSQQRTLLSNVISRFIQDATF